MTITVSRNSGVFTPELSDRINAMSDELYESIQEIESPDIPWKEEVEALLLSCSFPMNQQCLRVGRTVIVNATAKVVVNSGGNVFVRAIELPYPPACDIIWLEQGSGSIWRCKAGESWLEINTNGQEVNEPMCYGVYTF